MTGIIWKICFGDGDKENWEPFPPHLSSFIERKYTEEKKNAARFSVPHKGQSLKYRIVFDRDTEEGHYQMKEDRDHRQRKIWRVRRMLELAENGRTSLRVTINDVSLNSSNYRIPSSVQAAGFSYSQHKKEWDKIEQKFVENSAILNETLELTPTFAGHYGTKAAFFDTAYFNVRGDKVLVVCVGYLPLSIRRDFETRINNMGGQIVNKTSAINAIKNGRRRVIVVRGYDRKEVRSFLVNKITYPGLINDNAVHIISFQYPWVPIVDEYLFYELIGTREFEFWMGRSEDEKGFDALSHREQADFVATLYPVASPYSIDIDYNFGDTSATVTQSPIRFCPGQDDMVDEYTTLAEWTEIARTIEVQAFRWQQVLRHIHGVGSIGAAKLYAKIKSEGLRIDAKAKARSLISSFNRLNKQTTDMMSEQSLRFVPFFLMQPHNVAHESKAASLSGVIARPRIKVREFPSFEFLGLEDNSFSVLERTIAVSSFSPVYSVTLLGSYRRYRDALENATPGFDANRGCGDIDMLIILPPGHTDRAEAACRQSQFIGNQVCLGVSYQERGKARLNAPTGTSLDEMLLSAETDNPHEPNWYRSRLDALPRFLECTVDDHDTQILLIRSPRDPLRQAELCRSSDTQIRINGKRYWNRRATAPRESRYIELDQGRHIRKVVFSSANVNARTSAFRLDLKTCLHEEKAFQMLELTGSAAFNAMCRVSALDRGYKLNGRGLFQRSDEVEGSFAPHSEKLNTELEILTTIGVDDKFVFPHQRSL